MLLKSISINKSFYTPEKFQVLKNISMDVKQAEFLTIVGKSGCGKSTLLYILGTLDTDYEGQLFFNDELLSGKTQDELSAFRNQHLGFVFQFHFLLPEFSVIENVMLPAMKLGKYSHAEIKERAYEKLKMVDVHEQALKASSKLSGGQQQRVAIARAMINDPDILIGDEPKGNLDSANSQRVQEIFIQLATEFGKTVIAVTHDTEFAARSHRTIRMSDGEIVG